jgi:hypothetical protein
MNFKKLICLFLLLISLKLVSCSGISSNTVAVQPSPSPQPISTNSPQPGLSPQPTSANSPQPSLSPQSSPIAQSSLSPDPTPQSSVQPSPQPTSPLTTVLIEPTLLVSESRPLNTENYWIAWRDPDLGYIAASKSGVPVTVPNYPPTNSRSSIQSPVIS